MLIAEEPGPDDLDRRQVRGRPPYVLDHRWGEVGGHHPAASAGGGKREASRTGTEVHHGGVAGEESKVA
jgi:hypothetical protein